MWFKCNWFSSTVLLYVQLHDLESQSSRKLLPESKPETKKAKDSLARAKVRVSVSQYILAEKLRQKTKEKTHRFDEEEERRMKDVASIS